MSLRSSATALWFQIPLTSFNCNKRSSDEAGLMAVTRWECDMARGWNRSILTDDTAELQSFSIWYNPNQSHEHVEGPQHNCLRWQLMQFHTDFICVASCKPMMWKTHHRCVFCFRETMDFPQGTNAWGCSSTNKSGWYFTIDTSDYIHSQLMQLQIPTRDTHW